MKIKKSIHGGDIYRNQVKLDFSVNINPLGMPEQVVDEIKKSVERCICYPDMECENLKKAISRERGADSGHILCTNGASEGFMAIVHAIRPKTCLVPMPSFYGYRKALAAVECEIKPYYLKKDKDFQLDEEILDYLDEGVDMVFLTNPNNPTGAGISTKLMLEIITRCRKKNIVAVVDECFIDFVKEKNIRSLAEHLEQFENLVIVWAFTKIYALPGLRLGSLFCGNKELLEKISSQLPEWNVSVPAQEAGKVALLQKEYVEKTVELVKKEREFLAEELKKEGIRVYPSCSDFLLLETEMSLYEELLKEGILIRDCSNFEGLEKGFYRIAVRTRKENQVLLDAIRRIAIKGA